MKVWSANVTSLNKRWPCMAEWEPDVIVAQETRLGSEAQKIMTARITQDGKVPIFASPMPLKGRKYGEAGGRSRAETIWDAQQGGLATIVRLAILAHRVEVMDAFYHLVEERRMEHTYLPCML